MTRILLTGTDQAAIDFFFENLSQDYELVTTSTRAADVEQHLNLFSPAIMLYCMKEDESEYEQRVRRVMYGGLPHERIAFGVVGTERLLQASDFSIPFPVSAGDIRQMLSPYEPVFPMQVEMDPPVAQKEEKEVELEKKQEMSELLKKITRKKILAIDDDPLVLKSLSEFLKEDFDVAVARSGDTAYRYVEKNHVDLLLIDFMMPGEPGTSTLRNLRTLPYARNTPAIFLTGANDPQTVAAIVATRPQGYLLKPIDGDLLMKKIHEVLG